jgi:phosphatidate cytidylyltransferase
LVGSAFGKTPLFKNISPNKTVEGFIGGVIGVLVFGLILSLLLNLNSIIIPLLIIGSFFSFAGDYFFSFLKRQSGVKDTGSILPGHGGILDRIDSHLPSMPILVILISYFT